MKEPNKLPKKGAAKSKKELKCPTCKDGELYTKNGYIWCRNRKCQAIFEQVYPE